jgi:SAM-dependent methyltransferase
LAARKDKRASHRTRLQPIPTPPASIDVPIAGTLAALFLLSACGLAWEISLTRLASATLTYHYAFVAVSLAVGGIGVGAALIYAARPLSLRAVSAWAAAAAAATFLVAPLLLQPLVENSGLGGLVVLALPPFIAIGAAVTGVFRAVPQFAPRFYAADLLGAGVGAAGTIFALNFMGPISLVFGLAVVSAIAGALLYRDAAGTEGLDAEGESDSPGRRRFALPVIAAVLLVAGLGATVAQTLRAPFGFSYSSMAGPPPDKTIVPILRDPQQHARIIDSHWDAFARTDVVTTADPSQRLIFTDGGAGTFMERWNGDLRSARGLRSDLETLPFLLGSHRTVLIIGSGGGIDILRALEAGAKHVTAVDWNAAAVADVRRESRYNGNLLHRHNVTMVVDDARHFLAHNSQKYDTILLNLVYTGAAQGTTDALAESYTFTTQAFRSYLQHLTPRGRIGVISHQALEGLRVFTTGLEALHQQSSYSYPDAMQHDAVLYTANQNPESRPTITVIQPSIFPHKELVYLRNRARGLHLDPLYVPVFYQTGSFTGLANGKVTLAQWLQGGSYNVGPTTDNQPFFFDLNLGLPDGLGVALRNAILLLLGTLVLALFLRPGSSFEGEAASTWLLALYASLLGIGFMCIEIPLIQRSILVLGEPSIALAVTLATILLAGGVGSLVAGRLSNGRLSLAVAPAAVALIALLMLLALSGVQTALLPLPQWSAIAGSVVLLVPIGFVLGIPFPLGLRLAADMAPGNIALMWALSAGFSMLGSILAALVAVQLGFDAVLLIGAGCYLAAAGSLYAVSTGVRELTPAVPGATQAAVAGSRR